MRPHVELIDEKDLIWHLAEFTHATGEARQKNLSYDEEDGSASLQVEFTSDWSRPSGYHQALTEWFVLSGEVQIGETTLTDGDYWCAPKGVMAPELTVKAGTVILLFREYGDWTFTPSDKSHEDIRDIDELVIKNSGSQAWFDVVDPENGSPMDFERGGTPVPGLFIKMLYHDTETGFYTRLIKAKPGWREHPLAHHPCFEEAYCLDGTFDYNFGDMVKGQYFFRPKGIRHGDFTAGENGTVWILRCDGQLVDWYTDNASVEMKGDPVNWGEGFPNTEDPMVVTPVRSKTVGPWKDPFYQ
jgi:hypothetical protein